jgi:hypothetical protein
MMSVAANSMAALSWPLSGSSRVYISAKQSSLQAIAISVVKVLMRCIPGRAAIAMLVPWHVIALCAALAHAACSMLLS